MTYQVKYEAEYECELHGHKFKAEANPFESDSEVICSICYQAWLANFPRAKQKTSAFEKQEEVILL